MGLFDDIKDMEDTFTSLIDGSFTNAISEAMRDNKINQKRPGIETLTFMRFPAGKAEEVRKIKTGLFGGGTKKKLADSIEDGRTTYAEVLAVARSLRSVEVGSDRDPKFDRREYFYKIAAPDGTILREDIPALAKEFAVTFEYNNGDSASETGKADKVNPDGYLHMFLVRYFLKDDEHYVLLTRDQFEDLSFLVKHAGSFWHYAEDGVDYKW